MDELQNRTRALKSRWDTVYETVVSNPQLWNYPLLDAEEVNTVVSTIVRLFDRVRAPSGYNAGFELAKACAISTLPAIESQLEQLVAQKFAHVPNFVTQLNQLLSASLSAMLTGTTDKDRLLASLSSEVTESVARAEKALKSIDGVSEKASERAKRLDALDQRAEDLEELITRLSTTEKAARDHLTRTLEVKDKAESTFSDLTDRSGETTELTAELNELQNRVGALVSGAEETQLQITGLLPGAASAGLAYAFESRAEKLVAPRSTWMAVFVCSILLMLAVAYKIEPEKELWQQTLSRLPYIAPLVWLAWFSAVQYGNSVRLEEDYRFKASTAKAFVGYRDHMQHLKDIDLQNADNALALLSERTVAVLSEPPGRVLGKSKSEAAPSSGVVGLAMGRDEPPSA